MSSGMAGPAVWFPVPGMPVMLGRGGTSPGIVMFSERTYAIICGLKSSARSTNTERKMSMRIGMTSNIDDWPLLRRMNGMRTQSLKWLVQRFNAMDRFMRLALTAAKKADPFPNPRVGAVLVKDGAVIGSGFHKAPGKGHAEIEAIEDAKRRTRNPLAARGATLYVTLEPCSHTAKRTPPCTSAIIREGIARVVYAMGDPNPLVSGKGAEALKAAGITVRGPSDGKAAAAINRRYISSITKKPFIAIKMAMSADGKTATRAGDSRWISSDESRALVHRMRTDFDAVMVGAGTICADDPELTSHGKGRDPYRVIVDGRLRIGFGARVLRKKDGKTVVATCERADKGKALALEKAGARVLVCGKESVDLKMLSYALNAMGLGRILVEGGSELNASALESGIVDRLYLFIAPKLVGGKDANGVIGGAGIRMMADATRLKNMKIRKVGPDFLIEANISQRR